MNDPQHYMRLALAEAKKGAGRTSPNPLVGAVIVRDGRIVGRGYHHKAGTPHAEIHALNEAKALAQGATLYVTLEPCNHTGRTPPCTEAILRAGIGQVVIGMPDLNPHVQGGGAAYLHNCGIVVSLGVLEHECAAINRPFIKHSRTGIPWIILKAGLSLDGRITCAPRQGEAITGAASNQFVHQLRDQVDALLIGVETALIDNPSLTTRLENKVRGQDPLRVVLDTHLRLPDNARMLCQDSLAQTWIFCGEKADQTREKQLQQAGARVIRTPAGEDNRVDMHQVFRYLGKHQISSVLVEGGSRIHGSLCQYGLIDELQLFYAPYIIGDGGTPLVQGYNRKEANILAEFSDIVVQQLGQDLHYRALIRQKTITGE